MTRKVLFVCTGNICRSPLAEVIAADRFAGQDLEFASAGTHAVIGSRASAYSVMVAEENGLDLEAHRAQQLTADLAPDLVFGMGQRHVNVAHEMFPNLPTGSVRLLGHPEAIVDPYGHDLAAYRTAYDHIDRSLAALTF